MKTVMYFLAVLFMVLFIMFDSFGWAVMALVAFMLAIKIELQEDLYNIYAALSAKLDKQNQSEQSEQ